MYTIFSRIKFISKGGNYLWLVQVNSIVHTRPAIKHQINEKSTSVKKKKKKSLHYACVRNKLFKYISLSHFTVAIVLSRNRNGFFVERPFSFGKTRTIDNGISIDIKICSQLFKKNLRYKNELKWCFRKLGLQDVTTIVTQTFSL